MSGKVTTASPVSFGSLEFSQVERDLTKAAQTGDDPYLDNLNNVANAVNENFETLSYLPARKAFTLGEEVSACEAVSVFAAEYWFTNICSNHGAEKAYLEQVRSNFSVLAEKDGSELMRRASEDFGTPRFYDLLKEYGISVLNYQYVGGESEVNFAELKGTLSNFNKELIPEDVEVDLVSAGQAGLQGMVTRLGVNGGESLAYGQVYSWGAEQDDIEEVNSFLAPESQYRLGGIEELIESVAYNEAWHVYWAIAGFEAPARNVNLEAISVIDTDTLDLERTSDFINEFSSDAVSLQIQPGVIGRPFFMGVLDALGGKAAELVPSVYFFTSRFAFTAVASELGVTPEQLKEEVLKELPSTPTLGDIKELSQSITRQLSDSQLESISKKYSDQHNVFLNSLQEISSKP